MKRSSLSLLALAYLAAPAAAQEYSDMLERVIPAIVTVGTVAAEDRATAAFGFGEEQGEESRVAYERPLYLRGISGSGSGFVQQRGGQRYIVTNAHVIANAAPDGIFVFSHQRSRYPARLVGADTYWDVAVLEIQPSLAPELRTLDVNASPLRVGTTVFAIGNPQGIRPYTITRGIVSGLNRAGGTATDGYLQHDAGTVFGNSGGPLVGTDGRVVGLNTAIGTHKGSPLTYIGLSLEGPRLERVVSDIIANGRVRRPYLGIYLESQRLPDGRAGIVLADTLPGSPAAAAGMPVGSGWELVAMNGETVHGLAEMAAALELISPTAPVQLAFRRGQETRSATVRPRQVDDALLAGIGAWVLEERLGISAAEDLSILFAPPQPPRRWGVFVPGDRGLVAVDATAERAPRQGDQIFQAGLVADDYLELYRATSLADIGIISRMVMPKGYLSLALWDGNAVRAVTTLVYSSTVL